MLLHAGLSAFPREGASSAGLNLSPRRGEFVSSPKRSGTPFVLPEGSQRLRDSHPLLQRRRRRLHCRRRHRYDPVLEDSEGNPRSVLQDRLTEAKVPPLALLQRRVADPQGRPRDSCHARHFLPERYRGSGPLRKREMVLGKAQAAWSKLPRQVTDLSVPIWYAGLYGVPNWHLRQSCSSKKMDDKRKGLALLVRMNYILDYYHKFRMVEPQQAFFKLPARKLRVLVRSHGPVYDYSTGSYRLITTGERMNTSYALSTDYCWKRALACTLRNFVHLLVVCNEPPGRLL